MIPDMALIYSTTYLNHLKTRRVRCGRQFDSGSLHWVWRDPGPGSLDLPGINMDQYSQKVLDQPYVEISKKVNGTPKSFILRGFSIINHPFSGPPF